MDFEDEGNDEKPICRQDGKDDEAATAREYLARYLAATAEGSDLCISCLGEVMLFFAVNYAKAAGMPVEAILDRTKELYAQSDVPADLPMTPLPGIH